MLISRYRTHFVWIVIAYAVLIALVLYPAFHEGFGARLALWNCVAPTLALIVLTSALGKSKRRFIASAVFAMVCTAVAMFFVAMWLFTPLDTDPHSSTTVLAFVFAPVWSSGIATVASGVAWLATAR